MRYGLPYQGSKNKLAKRIVDLLPAARHLYDVFAGGCAVSHAALLSGKYGCVHFSDTNDVVRLFRDALEGNVPDGSEWISREEFLRRKDTDPYVRVVWSFGNNQNDYLYGRDIEPYKKAVHEMIFAPTPNERRLKFHEVCRLMPMIINKLGAMQTRNVPDALSHRKSAEALPPTQLLRYQDQARAQAVLDIRLSVTPPPPTLPDSVANAASDGGGSKDMWRVEPSRLEAEERRRQLERPFCGGEYEMRVADYRDIEILPESIIYADPPYKGKKEYRDEAFDHEAFYGWCEEQIQPLYISEYWMPEDRFVAIAEFERISTLSPTSNRLRCIERIYRPIGQIE